MSSWITSILPPGIKALFDRNTMPDTPPWIKCNRCEYMIANEEYVQNHRVCCSCGHHAQLTAHQRLDIIFDEYKIIDIPHNQDDPIKFVDTKKYINRLSECRAKTQMHDAALVVNGKIKDKNLATFIMDFRFIGGSMGTYVGNAFIEAVQLAAEQKIPFLAISASGGARMQEGLLSLMQMPRTIAALQLLKKHNLPYISLMTHPTSGGVVASFAIMGDILLSEPDTMIGFTGARVIKQIIKQGLPDNFQTSEYLYQKGMLDAIIERKNLKSEIYKIVKLFSCNRQNRT